VSASRATPAEAAAVAGGVVLTLGVVALAAFPALGWAVVVGAPLLAVVAAAGAARAAA